MKKQTIILLVVLGVIIFFLLINQKQKQALEQGKFLDFEMYDKDMHLITPKNTYSIVNGNEGVFYIKFKLTAFNTGKRTLRCEILDVPSSEALSLGYNPPILVFKPINTTSTIQIINPYAKYVWNTSIIEASLLESENIVTIIGRVKCAYQEGTEIITLPYKTGVLQIYVKPDEEIAGFDISIYLEVRKCGDGICSSLESLLECPQDCVF